MRSKSIVLLALALGCGLIASIGISQVMEHRNNSNATPGQTETIFVALTDINPNDLITPKNIKLEEWPKNKVPQGSLRKLDEVEGKRCRIKLFAGEPILAAKVMGANESQGATNHIPKGYRVVAVRVDSVSGGGSLILPGDRVDVLVYLSRNESLGVLETSTKTILQDVKVFAVDTSFQRNPDTDESSMTAKTISLLVTPQQAEKVTLATEMGTIRLILRNHDDNAPVAETDGAKISDVVGGDQADRDNEVNKKPDSNAGAGMATAAKGLLDLINSHRNSKSATPEAAPPVSTGPWKMSVLSGSDLSEVQINTDNSVPIVVGTETAAPAPPDRLPEVSSEVDEEPAASSEDPSQSQDGESTGADVNEQPVETDDNPLRAGAVNFHNPLRSRSTT